ncbi:hypothetical protein Hanom_Chr17g01547341 [Helianthus anomalus]
MVITIIIFTFIIVILKQNDDNTNPMFTAKGESSSTTQAEISVPKFLNIPAVEGCPPTPSLNKCSSCSKMFV